MRETLVLIFNKRTIRTVVQLILGGAIGIPIVLELLPPDQATSAQVVEVLAICAGITRTWNLLEDRGLVPAWLKDDTPQVVVRLTPIAALADLENLHTKVDALTAAQREARPDPKHSRVMLQMDDTLSGQLYRAAEAASELDAALRRDTDPGDNEIPRGDV